MGKMAEKIMKRNEQVLYLLLSLAFFASCKARIIQYKISDRYSGPCTVFVVPSSKNKVKSEVILVDKGLGSIAEDKMKQKFSFNSMESGKELEIIPIGKDNEAKDSTRYIFRLTNDITSSNCIPGDIHKLSFFVGSKSELKQWSANYDDELEYFQSVGIDWCRYYKDL